MFFKKNSAIKAKFWKLQHESNSWKNCKKEKQHRSAILKKENKTLLQEKKPQNSDEKREVF